MDSSSSNSSFSNLQVQIMRNRKRINIKEAAAVQEEQGLLRGLPEHVAQLVLSRVHNPSLLYSVCRPWRSLIYSPCFPPFHSLYAIISSPPPSSIEYFCFDPISQKWSPFPSPNTNTNHTTSSSFPSFVTQHPSFVARELPIQSISVRDHLVIIAATARDLSPAISRPLIFNPLTTQWYSGPPISTPRRWCITGSIRNNVYMASGVGASGYNQDIAGSVEKWVFTNKENCEPQGQWENKMAPMLRHGRFSREAVEAVGWRGKLCVVNIKGNVTKEGVVYDQEKDRWQEMPQGMLSGWNGPTASAEEDESVMYSVDKERGALMRYEDAWEVVLEYVDEFRCASQISARGGKVCVVCGGKGPRTASVVVVVDVLAKPPRIVFRLGPPPGGDSKFVSVHVLPRMPISSLANHF